MKKVLTGKNARVLIDGVEVGMAVDFEVGPLAPFTLDPPFVYEASFTAELIDLRGEPLTLEMFERGLARLAYDRHQAPQLSDVQVEWLREIWHREARRIRRLRRRRKIRARKNKRGW